MAALEFECNLRCSCLRIVSPRDLGRGRFCGTAALEFECNLRDLGRGCSLVGLPLEDHDYWGSFAE